jgi:hypothetical protein
MFKDVNSEYIKALINWAVDAWQSFPKKSDYVDSDSDSGANDETSSNESESEEFYLDSVSDMGERNN